MNVQSVRTITVRSDVTCSSVSNAATVERSNSPTTWMIVASPFDSAVNTRFGCDGTGKV